MRQTNVQVNLNHIKKDVMSNYFMYRDIFYKCFIINLVLYGQTVRPILNNTVIEDTGYQKLYLDVINGETSIQTLMNDMAIPNAGHILADLNVYTSSLFDHHHRDDRVNLYRMHFRPDGNLIMENIVLPCKH